MRASIVGTGGIAKIHARIVHELHGELVGVVGRTQASAEAFGVGAPYDSLTRLLNELQPDVVHVCTPNYLHAEQAIEAFRAGAHVLCEKPLATGGADGLRMMEAADKADRIGAVAYCYRGYPLIEVLRSRVINHDFGKLRRICGCYLSQDVLAPTEYVWHFTPGSVGPAFALMDYGVHWFDLAEYATDDRIVEVTSLFSTHQKKRIWRGLPGQGPQPRGTALSHDGIEVSIDLEDQADLLIRFESGAAGSTSISAVSPGNPNNLGLVVDGSEAGFDWYQQSPNTYVERGVGGNIVNQRMPRELPAELGWMSSVPSGHAEGYVDAFRNVVNQAWAAMRGENVRYPTFADGLRGLVLVEAAVKSAASRRPAEVPGAG